MKHLLTLTEQVASSILTGKKLVYAQFSKSKTEPYGSVDSKDIVYIKVAKKGIIGQFRVQKVIFFDGLKKGDIEQIRTDYGVQIAESRGFWLQTEAAKFATLIFVGEVNTFITPPIEAPKRESKRWVILDKRT